MLTTYNYPNETSHPYMPLVICHAPHNLPCCIYNMTRIPNILLLISGQQMVYSSYSHSSCLQINAMNEHTDTRLEHVHWYRYNNSYIPATATHIHAKHSHMKDKFMKTPRNHEPIDKASLFFHEDNKLLGIRDLENQS